MTRIDGPRDAASRSPAEAPPSDRRDGRLDASLARFGASLRDAAAGFQADPSLGEASEREADFRERLQHAVRDEVGRRDETEIDPATLRLLAEAVRPAGLPSAAPVVVAAPGEGEGAARVEMIEARVAAALAAAERGRAGEGVTLRLDLSDLKGAGASTLAVSLTADGLDVTLVAPAGGVLDASLRQSAQALAERLQQRFPRRTVRIFEAEAPAAPAAAEAGGLDGIAALLRGRGA